MPNHKVLSFDSWVTRSDWYAYAARNRAKVPHILVDRSPCTDPFFDPFQPPGEQRPVISGLCRCWKGFRPGDRYAYITRIHPKVAAKIGRLRVASGPCYLIVAVLEVIDVWTSHSAASKDFSLRQYVVEPSTTPYPPNLAHAGSPVAAVARTACIVHAATPRKGKRPIVRALTPDESTDKKWRAQYQSYRLRQSNLNLLAARCKFVSIDGVDLLCLDPSQAPLIDEKAWATAGNKKMNSQGILVPGGCIDDLARRLHQALITTAGPSDPRPGRRRSGKFGKARAALEQSPSEPMGSAKARRST